MSKDTPDTGIVHPQDQQPADSTCTTTQSNTKKRKKPSSNPAEQTASFSIRNPTHHYLHLNHISPSSSTPLDSVTVHLYLTAALTTFLGLHGSAIAFDILKLEPEERSVWVRVPAEDRAAVIASVSGWVGSKGESWKVGGKGSAWVAGMGGAEDLFE
jgi:ribonuclease P/MRP protein subunit POP8